MPKKDGSAASFTVKLSLCDNIFNAEIYKIVKEVSSRNCYFMGKFIYGKKIVVGKKGKAANFLIVTFS